MVVFPRFSVVLVERAWSSGGGRRTKIPVFGGFFWRRCIITIRWRVIFTVTILMKDVVLGMRVLRFIVTSEREIEKKKRKKKNITIMYNPWRGQGKFIFERQTDPL